MQTVQLHLLSQALSDDPQRGPLILTLLALIGVAAIVHTIVSTLERRADRREKLRNEMLLRDPRQIKRVGSLYCPPDTTEADWLNNKAMRQIRQQAKTLR